MKSYKYIFVILALALLAACSTTTSVPEDDQLFIGLKTTKYVDYEPSDHFNAHVRRWRQPLPPNPTAPSSAAAPYVCCHTACGYIMPSTIRTHASPEWVRKTFGQGSGAYEWRQSEASCTGGHRTAGVRTAISAAT